MASRIIGRLAELLGRHRAREDHPEHLAGRGAVGHDPPAPRPAPSPLSDTPPAFQPRRCLLNPLEGQLLAAVRSGGGTLLLSFPSLATPRLRIGKSDHAFSDTQQFESALAAIQRLARLGLIERVGASQSGESFRLTAAGFARAERSEG